LNNVQNSWWCVNVEHGSVSEGAGKGFIWLTIRSKWRAVVTVEMICRVVEVAGNLLAGETLLASYRALTLDTHQGSSLDMSSAKRHALGLSLTDTRTHVRVA